MHHTPIDNLNFTRCSLFSSQEFSIESGNLHITDNSLGKNNKETIPLDLIEPQPKVSKKNDKQLIWAATTSFIIGLLFLISTISIEMPIQQILGFSFIGISFLFLLASSKLKTTSYTYFYANTTTQLFTIHDKHSGGVDDTTQNAKKFIKSLNQRITKPKKTLNTRRTNKENYNEFIEHLDFLYNHSVITNIQYDRMQAKIQEVVYGIKREKVLADVIPLPLNNF